MCNSQEPGFEVRRPMYLTGDGWKASPETFYYCSPELLDWVIKHYAWPTDFEMFADGDYDDDDADWLW